MDKYEVVTLCGSTKFKRLFGQIRAKLELDGKIVIPLGEFESLTPEQHELIVDMHWQKIRMCNTIFVINPGGYIGDGTRVEIEYAEKLTKNIIYLESDEGSKYKPVSNNSLELIDELYYHRLAHP